MYMNKGQQKKKSNPILTGMGLALFFKLNVWIVAPVLGSIFLGKWLDQKMETESKFTVILIGFAFVFSMIGLIVESRKAIKEIDVLGNKNGQNSTSEDKKVEKIKSLSSDVPGKVEQVGNKKK
jgi:hypothetical protein